MGKKLDISNLPYGVSISTMCASGKLGTKLFNDNIANYLELDSDNIITVKQSDDKIRTLRKRIKKKAKKKKNSTKKKKNKEKSFYKQVTVEIRVNEGEYVSLDKEN